MISEAIEKVDGLGETWVKMLMIVIDIAFPQLKLLRDRCVVGIGAKDPLQSLLHDEGLVQQTQNKSKSDKVQKSAAESKAMEKLREKINTSKVPSNDHFWELLARVEAHGREHFKHLPLVVSQMQTPKQELSAATVQVQLCELRQFEASMQKQVELISKKASDKTSRRSKRKRSTPPNRGSEQRKKTAKASRKRS
eukprot:gnl/TRDRNA2_/TRDRNA2_166387_c3_seq3.p2 gnl/TRDRNA2_/TRDRNA2_166387_c3~~gnl/TRDRNA2_/TRDRNA2_166387_c3_seq3.p2  ORF type:complete len:217 (+),score=57.93 gnl/TRDRNA2_/TRDRNA2_166387_c3_seq3:68-652(+)